MGPSSETSPIHEAHSLIHPFVRARVGNVALGSYVYKVVFSNAILHKQQNCDWFVDKSVIIVFIL